MAEAPRRETFNVRGAGMCSPEGYFILVRRHEDRTAIKFTGARVGSEKGTAAARFEAFFVPRGSSLSASAGRVHREGTVSIDGWTGFHPLSRQLGEYRVKIETIRIIYSGGSCLLFEPGYEYAPTPWRSIDDVDDDAALRWYRHDGMSEMSLDLKPSEALERPAG
jgi:hypothetical protein